MWMKFDGRAVGENMVGEGNAEINTIYALNGEIVVGHTIQGLHRVNFIDDTAYRHLHTQNMGITSINISQRLSLPNWSYTGGIGAIVESNINDVHAAVIDGKTYVAVATDGGVSVINETDGTVVDLYLNATYKTVRKVFIAGDDLYAIGMD